MCRALAILRSRRLPVSAAAGQAECLAHAGDYLSRAHRLRRGGVGRQLLLDGREG